MPKINKHTYKTVDLAYWDLGEGPVLLMVHGFCEQKSMFEPFLELAKSNRLIIPDLPGFGASDLPNKSGSGSIAFYAETLLSLIKKLELENIHFIGHSMGAYIGLELLSNQGHLFESFCLFHSHPYADSAEIKQKRLKSIDFLRKHGTATFFKPFFANLFPASKRDEFQETVALLAEDSKGISAEAIIFAQQAMADRSDHSATLKNFNGIVHYIVGALDEIAPSDLGMQQTLLGRIGLFHLVPDCGHMGQWEKPALILQHFKELQKISATLKK
jgi:pimeloyl-ACP methyl ester carboxylesterase